MTWTVEERRSWAFPPVEGELGEIDLGYLDPADPDDRSLLIRFEHPEFEEAREAGWDEIVIDGEVMNPHLHLAIHEVVANQLWDGEPPETWQTARRLNLLGYERHEVFHMIGSVVAEEVWQMMHDQQEADLDRLKEKLAALPGPWEMERTDRARRRKRPPNP